MMEILDLYNADRILTGDTIIRGEKVPDGSYILNVHVCIFNSNGELLIQKRSENKSRWPGLWDLSICGAVVSGETSREAGMREACEELGISVDLGMKRPVVTVNYEDGFDDFFAVTADLDIDSISFDKKEVEALMWADLKEVEEMIEDGRFFPADINLLRFIFSFSEGND